MNRLILILAALLALAGCDGSVPIDHEDHRFEDGEDVDLGAQPWRERRRLDVDQLDASIREVTGGIGWESWRDTGGGNWEVSERYFQSFGDTLGVPDYINSTSEDLTVSLLFEKFLDDAARDVCRRLADREGGEGRAYDGDAQGVFAPVDVSTPSAELADADRDQALSNLLLRFHGREVEPASEQLQPWRDLHGRLAAVAAADDSIPPRRAWEGVCVALMTHPDFYTY